MGIGIGIALLVIGLIVAFALQFDLPGFNNHMLGIILIVVGVLAIILSFLYNYMRTRSRHVSETRVEGGAGTQTEVQQVRREDPPVL